MHIVRRMLLFLLFLVALPAAGAAQSFTLTDSMDGDRYARHKLFGTGAKGQHQGRHLHGLRTSAENQ